MNIEVGLHPACLLSVINPEVGCRPITFRQMRCDLLRTPFGQ